MRHTEATFRAGLGVATSFVALIAVALPAIAGGFSPKEQSSVFLGSAFAGSAAGGSLGSMFWNSAAVGQFDGVNSESAYSLILPDSEITSTGSTLDRFGASSGDIGDTAVLPASYFSYQLNSDIVLGMSVNAPFGLTTDGKFTWAGSVFARESKIETYNFNPTVAYRVAPGVVIGAGLQVEYIKAQLRSAFNSPLGPTAVAKGDDTAVGFTAGVILTPAAGTTIGLGYRSSIDHELEGTFHVSRTVPVSSVSADLETPEIVTLSARQELSDAWTLLGTVEWNNWSRVQQLAVVCERRGPACPAAGATISTLPLGWEDGWFFSGGLEHEYNALLTLRGGIAYEISPIQDPEGRTLRVPDADRVWLTAGASYKYSEWTMIDVAYAHVFVEDSKTVQTAGPVTLNGDVESSVDVISVGVRSKLDWLFAGAN